MTHALKSNVGAAANAGFRFLYDLARALLGMHTALGYAHCSSHATLQFSTLSPDGCVFCTPGPA